MSDTNRDLLLKIYKELQETKDKVKDIPEMKKQLEEVPKMKDEIVQIKKQVKEIPKMKDEISQIKKTIEDMPEIKQELRSISGSVARIEVEHGEKLMALFDAFKMHTDKIQEQDKKIAKCENTLEKHDHQIYILNSEIHNKKVQNA